MSLWQKRLCLHVCHKTQGINKLCLNTAKALGFAEVLKQFVVAKMSGEQGSCRAKSLLLLGHTCVALSPSNDASVRLYVGDALDHVRSELNEISA